MKNLKGTKCLAEGPSTKTKTYLARLKTYLNLKFKYNSLKSGSGEIITKKKELKEQRDFLLWNTNKSKKERTSAKFTVKRLSILINMFFRLFITHSLAVLTILGTSEVYIFNKHLPCINTLKTQMKKNKCRKNNII